MSRSPMRCTALFTSVAILLTRVSGQDTNAPHDVLTFMTDVVDALSPDVLEFVEKVGCNFLYHAILHVHLSHVLFVDRPDDDSVRCRLYPNSFHDWSKKMLVIMSYFHQTRPMMGPMWAFFMYTHQTERQTVNRGQRSTTGSWIRGSDRPLYAETFEILRDKLQTDCPVLETPDGVLRTHDSYIADVTGETRPTMLMKNYNTSYKWFVKDIFKDRTESIVGMFTADRLLLTTVLDDPRVLRTLTAGFGLIPPDGAFENLLVSNYLTVSDAETALPERLVALHSVHFYFVSMVKIMMLRLCLYHLASVQRVVFATRRSRYNGMILNVLRKFTRLLGLTDDDELKRFAELLDCQTNGETETIETIRIDGTQVLDEICQGLPLNNADLVVIDSMELSAGRLREIAESAGIVMRTESVECGYTMSCFGVENTILYADVFVDYLTKKLSAYQFSLIYLFMNTHAP